MKKTKLIEEVPEDEVDDLTPEEIQELKRRMADFKNPVRYVVYSQMLPKRRWLLFLDISSDTYCDQLDTATLFKQKHVAHAIVKVYSEGRKKDLLVAKITTKGDKRRVLKYDV